MLLRRSGNCQRAIEGNGLFRESRMSAFAKKIKDRDIGRNGISKRRASRAVEIGNSFHSHPSEAKRHRLRKLVPREMFSFAALVSARHWPRHAIAWYRQTARRRIHCN